MNSDHLSDWLTFINSNRPNESDFGLERLEDVYTEIVKSPLAKKNHSGWRYEWKRIYYRIP